MFARDTAPKPKVASKSKGKAPSKTSANKSENRINKDIWG